MFWKKDFVTFVDSWWIFLRLKNEKKKEKVARISGQKKRERERDSPLSYGLKSCYLHERKPLARNSSLSR